MDTMVLKTQQWLNLTYGDDSRFNRVTEDGITGWDTIYGLRRALQIEEGITSTSNSFGPSTYDKCPDINILFKVACGVKVLILEDSMEIMVLELQQQ